MCRRLRKKKLICIATDAAAADTGPVARLKHDFPEVHYVHWTAHTLQFAVKD